MCLKVCLVITSLYVPCAKADMGSVKFLVQFNLFLPDLPLLQDPPSIHSKLAEFPELRVSTITPASVRLLQNVVDWQDIAPPKSAAFSDMQVWDS